MNEEISVTLVNNTSLVQPVSLFTEVFAIPQNLVAANNTFSWDLTNEFFFWGFETPTAQIQYSTTPTNSLTPYTSTGALPSQNVNGVVSALNTLGIGTFTSIGNIVSVQSSNFFYGGLNLSPDFLISITSNTPNVAPAITITVNGNNILSLPSGTNSNTALYGVAQGGDNISVGYSAGAGAISWAIGIQQNQAPPNPPINIFTNSGAGAITSFAGFSFPTNGQILITLVITP